MAIESEHDFAAGIAPPVTLGEMARVVTWYADDCEAFQHRRVLWGWRRRLDPEKMREVAVLHKVVELINRIGANERARAALGFQPVKEGGAS
jgi:hypothetical protein